MQDLILGMRILVIFCAASGYLFGQLFFGDFAWHATIAGVFGTLAGSLGGKFGMGRKENAYIVVVFCVLAIIGVIFDAYNYYTNSHAPGNYFGWFLKGPFIASLLVIGIYCYKKSPNKSLKNGTPESGAP